MDQTNNKKENNIRVIFSDKSVEAKANEVIISPIETDWNDFGNKVRCHLSIGPITLKPRTYEGDIFFGFLNIENDSIDSIKKNETRIQVISATTHYAARPSKILPKKTS